MWSLSVCLPAGSLPGQCNFESGMCGYIQDKTEDKVDWLRVRGHTPTSYTGPRGDHTTGVGESFPHSLLCSVIPSMCPPLRWLGGTQPPEGTVEGIVQLTPPHPSSSPSSHKAPFFFVCFLCTAAVTCLHRDLETNVSFMALSALRLLQVTSYTSRRRSCVRVTKPVC